MLYVEEDIYAKSGFSQRHHQRIYLENHRRSPHLCATNSETTRIEEELLLSKATQIDISTATTGETLEISKNRARRMDAERDLDQPALAEADAEPDIANAKSKRKRARMVLGETRAAESDSESTQSSSAPDSPSGSSQSVRTILGVTISVEDSEMLDAFIYAEIYILQRWRCHAVWVLRLWSTFVTYQ